MRKNEFSEETKKKVLLKNKGFCEVCRFRKITEFHHIIPATDEGTSDEKNCAGLCYFCHDRVPGNYPDGYEDEFYIYKENGGDLFRLTFAFFQFGCNLENKKKNLTFEQIWKEYNKGKEGVIKSLRTLVNDN